MGYSFAGGGGTGASGDLATLAFDLATTTDAMQSDEDGTHPTEVSLAGGMLTVSCLPGVDLDGRAIAAWPIADIPADAVRYAIGVDFRVTAEDPTAGVDARVGLLLGPLSGANVQGAVRFVGGAGGPYRIDFAGGVPFVLNAWRSPLMQGLLPVISEAGDVLTTDFGDPPLLIAVHVSTGTVQVRRLKLWWISNTTVTF